MLTAKSNRAAELEVVHVWWWVKGREPTILDCLSCLTCWSHFYMEDMYTNHMDFKEMMQKSYGTYKEQI